MSDAEVSDVELDEDFTDFDPVRDVSEGEYSGDEAPGPAEGEEGEEGEGEEAEDGEAEAAPPRDRARRPAERQRPAETRRVILVPPEERVTSHVMTLAEVTQSIAVRAQQIADHPNVFTDIGGLTDPKDIARKELLDRRSPLRLRRTVGRTPAGEAIVEVWNVREMTYPAIDVPEA